MTRDTTRRFVGPAFSARAVGPWMGSPPKSTGPHNRASVVKGMVAGMYITPVRGRRRQLCRIPPLPHATGFRGPLPPRRT